MKIINCCPHAVTVFVGTIYNPRNKRHTGGKPIISFPESGYVANAECDINATEPLVVDGEEVPACTRKFSSVSPLPGDDPSTMYIVSSMYAQASEELGLDVSRLLTPCGDVYTETGFRVGCTGLVRYKKKETSNNELYV